MELGKCGHSIRLLTSIVLCAAGFELLGDGIIIPKNIKKFRAIV